MTDERRLRVVIADDHPPTRDDIRREYRTEKSCAPHCTVSCVHQVSYVDFFRGAQSARPLPSLPEESPDLVQIQSD